MKKVKLTQGSFTAFRADNGGGLILKDLGIKSIGKMKKTFIEKRSYKRISFFSATWPSLENKKGRIVDCNYFLARQLYHWGLISKKSYLKELPVWACGNRMLSKRTSKKLFHRKWYTAGDLYDNFLNKDGSFRPAKRGKGIGPAVNYSIANLLHWADLLKQDEFEKVAKPMPKLRIPTEEEIGEDGVKLLSTFEWSEVSKKVITISVGKVIMGCYYWKRLCVRHLVQRFVRIDKENKTHFNAAGHRQSRWYSFWNATGELEGALIEIRQKLEDLNFLEREEVASVIP